MVSERAGCPGVAAGWNEAFSRGDQILLSSHKATVYRIPVMMHEIDSLEPAATLRRPDGPVQKDFGTVTEQVRQATTSSSTAAKPEPVAATLSRAMAAHHAGRLDEAEAGYRLVLEQQPEQPDAANYLGVLLHQTGHSEEAILLLRRSTAQRPDSSHFHTNLGRVLQDSGNVAESIGHYRAALALDPRSAEAWNNLGTALMADDDVDEAAAAFTKAVDIKPDYPEALHNLGNARVGQSRNDDAIASYRQAIALDPNLSHTHNSLGMAYQTAGRVDEAVAAYRSAIALDITFTEAIGNIGAVFKDDDRMEDAIAAFRQIVVLKPDSADALGDLGSALNVSGNYEEAIAHYRHALEIQPDNAQTNNNLGTALQLLGDYGGAVDAYLDSIALEPGNLSTFLHLSYPLIVIADQCNKGESDGSRDIDEYIDRAATHNSHSFESHLLRYTIDAIMAPDRAPASYRLARERLPNIEDETIALAPVSRGAVRRSKSGDLPRKCVALLHFGRSGSGFIHSLIDGHSQVTTLPGVYLKGFFGPGIWRNMTEGSSGGLPDRFVSTYEVLFDATSRRSVPGDPMSSLQGLGEADGFTTMGEDRSTALSADVGEFKRALSVMLERRDSLHQGDFFRMIHRAFESAIGRTQDQDTIFHHIHNPTSYDFANFLKYFPDARPLVIVREPLQSCESWVSSAFDTRLASKNSYKGFVLRVISMLFQVDKTEYKLQESAGIRLEDLKNDRRATIQALCKWMGIDEEESLYSSTMQGLKWWGEPNGATHGEADQWGKKAISRKVGTLFSESDQFILRTLYYPFRCLYGYAERDDDRFRRDLTAIAPMIDAPFDFERAYFENHGLDPTDMTSLGTCRYFRAALRARWRVLDQTGTYPGMITPLTIE